MRIWDLGAGMSIAAQSDARIESRRAPSRDAAGQRIRHLRIEVVGYAKPANAISADFGQPLRIGDRKAPESDRINQLKDGGVFADAEGK